MKKKIIFLLFNPLDERNYQRYGFSVFEKNGWDIECWIFYDKIFKDKTPIKKEYVYTLKSFFDCIKRIKKLPKDFIFIDLSKRDFISYFLQRLMIIKGGKRVLITVTEYPYIKNISVKTFLFQKFSYKNLKFFIEKLIRISINLTIIKALTPKPNYHFLCGYEAYDKARKISKKTEIIEIHCLNYDNYLNLKDKPIDEKYKDSIVYLDQDYEGNYTYALEGEIHPTSKEDHWNSLNNLFEKLSIKFNKKIIIAAHPRRNRKAGINTPHQVIFDETANLIKNAFLIIGHDSISLEYAIMFNKPVMFITTNQIQKDKQSLWIKKFADEFGKAPINIDNPVNLNDNKILSFDKNIYNRYLERYIKTPNSYNGNFWNNFINFFEK
jgi:hypothetical protein